MGVFESVEQAKATLNALIDTKLAQLQQDNPNCPRALAGVEDDAWHPSLVADVVKARGFHFKKLKLKQLTNLAAVLSRARECEQVSAIEKHSRREAFRRWGATERSRVCERHDPPRCAALGTCACAHGVLTGCALCALDWLLFVRKWRVRPSGWPMVFFFGGAQ